MLANVYLDVAEGLMTRKEATEYLCTSYEHHPSPRSVVAYLAAARKTYQSLTSPRGRKKKKSPPGSDLQFQMRLAIEQRAGD